MSTTDALATFITDTSYDDLPAPVIEAAKRRLLDSVGIALGALEAAPAAVVRETVGELHPEGGPVTLWGGAGSAAAPQAAMLNTTLIRYLDYMDAILLPGETPHPSDTIGAAIAAAEADDRSGAELLTGITIAYEVHGEMAAKAPGRDIGWDHIHVNFGATAAACKLLGLGYEQSRQAVGIATASYNPLRVIRTGAISMYKGVASANMARNGVYTALLARNGMEGPTDAFEGQKGWEEIVQGRSFEVSFGVDQWIREVMMKRYMAGTHAQPAIEGLLELVERESIDPTAIEEIHLETYASAKHVMGGGEGDRHLPANREQADHSIPYTLAAAALDGQLLSPQYEPDRIASDDVRRLMGTVTVAEDPALSDLFDEGAQPYDISVTTGDGQRHQIEKRSFQGHPETPMSWAHLEEKFHTVAADAYDRAHRERIVTTVRNLEQHSVADLTALL